MSGRNDAERFDAPFFDTVRDRAGTNSLKYGAPPTGAARDVLPMWVADMDFPSPPAVQDALARAARQGVYGYTELDGSYWELLRAWYRKRMDWATEAEWYVRVPNVLAGVSAALFASTQEGDGVLLCEPAYYPFARILQRLGREVVVSGLREENGRYTLDFADLDEKAKRCKALLFCSPHNPVGRVWERAELEELGRVCRTRGLCVISDEIHADLVFPPRRHVPVTTVSEDLAKRSVVCMAPTKTFNLAGLHIAHLIVPDPVLRRRVLRACSAMGQGGVNLMSLAAASAAYREGEAWLDGLLTYLRDNRQLLYDAFPAGGPIRALPTEGTYLAWLDCRALSLDTARLDELFLNKAGVWLDNGAMFGAGGKGFMRLNFACPRGVLREAAGRIGNASRGIHASAPKSPETIA